MQTQEMPFQMRVAIIILFSLLVVMFLTFVIDEVFSNITLKSTKAETTGILDSKTQTHGKDGYKYYFKYHFTVNNTEYHQTWLFGLLDKSTQVQLSSYNMYENGSELLVNYSKPNPNISVLKDISNDRSYLVWELLGILVFGSVAINELRFFLMKTKKS